MSAASSPPRWLIVDTDAGVDDAVALAMAFRLGSKFNYEIKMITTVFGNCSLENVITNVAKTRAACGLDAVSGPPMYAGEKDPLVGQRIDAGYFHGNDGLGNNSFPEEATGLNEGDHAVDKILEVCAEARQKGISATLLALGPLTNLARVIEKDASVLRSLDKVVMIGGCGNARGNVCRTTEFNVTADPEAAQNVMAALLEQDVVCTLVSWELTLAYSIPWEVYDEVMSDESAKRSRLNNFLKEICQVSYGSPHLRIPVPHFSHPGEHFGGAVICDVLAMVVALNPDSVIEASEEVNVEVELDGKLTRGQTVVDWGCFDGVVRKKNCSWVTRVNHNAFISMFKEIFD
ncbi:unnamed protein product [Ectocarpus fasciculatus]